MSDLTPAPCLRCGVSTSRGIGFDGTTVCSRHPLGGMHQTLNDAMAGDDVAPAAMIDTGTLLYDRHWRTHYTVVRTTEGEPVLRPAKAGEIGGGEVCRCVGPSHRDDCPLAPKEPPL